jgi:hypothetical protein
VPGAALRFDFNDDFALTYLVEIFLPLPFGAGLFLRLEEVTKTA